MNILEAFADGTARADTATAGEIAEFVAAAALQAPSLANSQPWRFYHADREFTIVANNERQLRIADPLGREMMMSCGAALFNARVALRYLNFAPKVRVLPDADLPNEVARMTWDEQVPSLKNDKDLFAQITRRRTHRGGFDAVPLPATLLAALGEAAAAEQATLTLLADDPLRTRAVAAVVEAGDCALRLDAARAKEEARWAPGPASHRLDGVLPTAYPAVPERTEPFFRTRDYAHGHDWGLPAHQEDPMVRSAGVVGVLSTAADKPADWIHAGQALQRVLLAAASSNVAAAMHSQPLEVPLLRGFMRACLCDGFYPQMVLRLGTTDERAVSVRHPAADVLFPAPPTTD
jgi:nitroreductase